MNRTASSGIREQDPSPSMADLPAAKSKRARIESIDKMRGLAAMMVLLLHARNVEWIGASAVWQKYGVRASVDNWMGYLSMPLRFGQLGVMLFFVISGFCIHRANVSLLIRGEPLPLRIFLWRRIRRIYPTLLGALILTALADFWVRAHNPMDGQLNSDSPRAFLINLFTLQGIAGPTYGSNAALWSLSIEEHLYLVYPMLFWINRRFGPTRTLLGCLIVSVPASCVGQLMPNTFFDFLPYLFTWVTGMFLADMEAGRASAPKLPYRSLAASSLVVALGLHAINKVMLANLCESLVFGPLVGWSITAKGQGGWSRFRLGPLLGWVGLVSYSLYAIHEPLLVLGRTVFLGGQPSWSFVLPVAGGVCGCIVAARVFFRLVEKRTLRAA